MNLAYGQGGLKLEINIPPQHILAKVGRGGGGGGLIIEGGVSSSEYGIIYFLAYPVPYIALRLNAVIQRDTGDSRGPHADVSNIFVQLGFFDSQLG